jgi:ribosome-binding protein aMBF1 (putative translation factor)
MGRSGLRGSGKPVQRTKRVRVITYKTVPVTTRQVERPYVLFGEFVRDARQDWGWNQLELAEKMKMSRGSIANIETGRQRVLLGDIFSFADALKVDAAKIFAHISA